MKKMKLMALMLSPLFLAQCGTTTGIRDIERAVIMVFTASDNHEWNQLKAVFADEVELDYSSFTGNDKAMLSPDQIMNSWSGFLTKFKATHHQLGNLQVKMQSDKRALVNCYGTATHFLPNQPKGNIWTVVGTYDFDVVKIDQDWKIKKMKFNFKYQDGNLELPKIAMGN